MMFGLSDEVIQGICSVFARHKNVDEVLVFGSRAKGNYLEGSDIDLAVKGNGLSFNQLLDIYIQIEDVGVMYKVDIVDYNKNLGTPIVAHIDRVGKVFYKKQEEK